MLWWFWQWQQRTRSDAWQQVCDAHLLPHLLVQWGGSRQRLVLWLIACGGLLAILALAGPTWSKRPQPVFETEQARVLVLDLSRSMDATDIKPSRLTQAKYKLLDILQNSKEGQTALLAFAGDVHVVSPLTSDADTIAAQVPTLNTQIMPIPGSRPLEALRTARDLLKQGGAASGDIILITDGVEDTATHALAAQLLEQGYRLSVLGIGTPQGAPIPLADGSFLKDQGGAIVVPRLDPGSLQRLAQAGGGIYAPYTADQRDLYYLLSPAADQAYQASEDNPISESWEEQGPWLLLLLLPVAALAFRKGWLLAVFPLFFIMLPDASAGVWDDLWHTRDQQGQQAFSAEQTEQAAQLFESPEWQGVAQYRAGNYQAAVDSFAQQDTADAHYNRGNALAKLGDLEGAKQAYQQALEKNPQHPQAKDNKALVEQLLEQKQQEQDSESGDQGEKGEQGEDGESKEQEGQQDSSQQEQKQDGDSGQSQDQQEGEGQQQPSKEQDGQSGEDSQPAPSQPTDDEEQQNPSSSSAQQDEQAPENAEDSSMAQADPKQEDAPSEEDIRQALQQQQEAGEEPPEGEQAQVQQAMSAEEVQAQEQAMALEQQLNRVQDDPGGLLRRKFAWEYQQRQLERQRRGLREDAPSGQTW